MSQSPLLIRNKESCVVVFFCPVKKAEIPARNKNVGAQKWVIHLVRNNGTVVVAKFVGLSMEVE
jgi:hypothetical protein